MTRRPNSARTSTARIRAAYTGETLTAALPGVPSGNHRDQAHKSPLGLDHCSEEQLHLRAQLAVGLFNRGVISGFGPHVGWDASTVTAYTITVSPRYNHLVLITETPDNVARRLANQSYPGLPGLRVVARTGRSSVLRSVITGARLDVTMDTSGHVDVPHSATFPIDVAGLHGSVRSAFDVEAELSKVPPMSTDTKHLLAGIAVRLSVTDPSRRWSTGNWFWDPLGRTATQKIQKYKGYEEYSRCLWGHGDDWELAWSGHPRGMDLIGALTDPVAGIVGVQAHQAHDHWRVTFGSAVLVLRTADLDGVSR